MKGIIYTAGIGRSEKSESPEKMAKRIGLPYKIFNWQQYIESDSENLVKIHTSYGSKTSKKMKSIMYDYIYDETSYCEKRIMILDRLKDLIDDSGFTDIVLIGHSWGAVIMHDYCSIKPDQRIETLITMGCPIPFKHGKGFTSPIFLLNWFNFWEKNDWIAHKMLKNGCTDIEFKSKSWLRGWNVASHTSYFVSRSLSKIIKKLLK